MLLLPKETPRTVREHIVAAVVHAGISLFVFVAGAVVAYVYREPLIAGLLALLPPESRTMQFLSPLDPFFLLIQLCAVTSVVTTLPLHVGNAWLYIRPIHTKRDALWFTVAVVALTGTIWGGLSYTYAVIVPTVLDFLSGLSFGDIAIQYNARAFLSFLITTGLLTTAISLMPFLIAFSIASQLTSSAFLRSKRRASYLTLIIILAVVSPTTDVLSLLLLAAPAIALYEVGIVAGNVLLQLRKK